LTGLRVVPNRHIFLVVVCPFGINPQRRPCSLVPNDTDTAFHGSVPKSSLPLKPELGVSCFWRLLVFADRQRQTPFSRAEIPPIAFVGEIKKQIRVRPDSDGKG
jgi:hypothetical protein